MTQLILILVVAGVICWLVSRAPFIDQFFKYCIYAVVGLFALYKIMPMLSAIGLS